MGNSVVGQSASSLVDPAATDVAHPFDDIMVTVVELGLKHLEVSHLQP